MPFETFFHVGSRSRPPGSNKGQNGHILSLSGPYLVHLCMDFKIILHICWPLGGEQPFETFLRRLKVKVIWIQLKSKWS